MNGQEVSKTEVIVQDAVEIEQDIRTSFASSLRGGFHHPIKKTVETMQVLKRGVRSRDNCLRLGSSFRTSLAH